MDYISKPTKVKIYVNAARKTAAQIKAETGCDAIVNGGLFAMNTFKAVGNLKAEGTEYSREWNTVKGYAWSGNDLPQFGWSDMKSADNFIWCIAMIENGAPLAEMDYPKEMGGARPRTAFGTFADGRVWMYASQTPTTPERLQAIALAKGVQDAIMLDGGGSTQGISPDETVTSSRVVHNFICVWTGDGYEDSKKPKEETTMAKYKVCLDAGHGGADKANGSPDGLFKEYKFTLDVALRIKKYLAGTGIEVILTRDEDESVSLATRAAIANAGRADLFVSVHSNAAGTAYADAEGWSDAKGLCVFTYGAGEKLERNVLANHILDEMRENGTSIHGAGLFHAKYVVLAQTNMPAVLIEYGFHTNKEEVRELSREFYRDRLAYNTAKAICKYLGVEEPLESDGKEPSGTLKEPNAEEWAKTIGIIQSGSNLACNVTMGQLIEALYKLHN